MRMFSNGLFSRASALLALASALLAPVHAAEIGVTDTEIVLGMNISLNGGKNDYAVSALQGMNLYFNAVNAKGGVNGRKLVQRLMDDENKSANTEANARAMAQGVFMFFGAIDGGPSTAVMKVANEFNVPFFGPLAGSPTMRVPHQPMVFPVRAEHKDEFRALMVWGKSTSIKTVGFMHADTEVGRMHLANVQLIAKELGMEVVLALPFKGEESDAQVADMASSIVAKQPGMFLNHGSAGLYQRLVGKAKEAGSRSTFMGVNSGSSQIVKALGPLSKGMVFTQVVPNPLERKFQIAREYQDAARLADPKAELSYGGLEGYLTAKALVMALRKTGKQPTRAGLIKTLESGNYDVGGLKMQFRANDHQGSQYVDTSIVSGDGRFLH
jgi:branched-chain amino acid transport system substrate-binding protein